MQVLCLFGFATLDPTTNLLAIAGLAVLASFISATFDIVLDAWRIETAQDQGRCRLVLHACAGGLSQLPPSSAGQER